MVSSLKNKISQIEEEIFNHVDAYVCTKDRAERYRYADQNILDLLGASIEYMISHENKQFSNPALSNNLIFNASRVNELEQTIKCEGRSTTKPSSESQIFLRCQEARIQ